MVTSVSLNQPLSLAANDFELFDLSRPELDARWKALQKQVHPDQFVSQGAVEKRLAMQWSVRINEAYQRLKTPLSRTIAQSVQRTTPACLQIF
jgi:molecular chaperone HscB